jgi:protease II
MSLRGGVEYFMAAAPDLVGLPQVIDYNMATGKRATKKVQPVLGGFSASDYVTDRLWATAPDGVKVRGHV